MKRHPLLIAALLLTGSIGAGLYATGQLDPSAWASANKPGTSSPAKKAVRPPAITVTHAVERTFRENVLVTGSLVPRREVLIAPQIEGQRVAALLADVGDRVAKGQVLARLETENLDARLAQNTARIATANATIAEARAAIAQAQARYDEAVTALARARSLRRGGHTPQSLLDQREATEKANRALLASARSGLATAKSRKAEAEAERIELDWRRTRAKIVSPVAGTIMRRAAKTGAIASGAGGTAMFEIIVNGEIELAGEFTGAELTKIKPDQIARLRTSGGQAVTGKVRMIAPEIDTATRLGHVRIFIGDKPGLRVGGFARGEIETAKRKGLAVPAGAVMVGANGPYVHSVVDSKVATQKVRLGLRSDGYVEVLEGLQPGAIIVAKAGTFLRDGDAITPVSQSSGKGKGDS